MAGPKTFFKVAGTWKQFTGMHYKVAGVWKNIPRAYVKVAGAWKLIFESEGEYGTNPGDLQVVSGDSLMADAIAVGLAGTIGSIAYATTPTFMKAATIDPFSDTDTESVNYNAVGVHFIARSSDGYTVYPGDTPARVAVLHPDGTETINSTVIPEAYPMNLMSDGSIYFKARIGSPTFSDFLYRVTNSGTPDQVLALGDGLVLSYAVITENNDSELMVAFANGDIKSMALGASSLNTVGSCDAGVLRLVIAGDDSVWTMDGSGDVKRNGVEVDTLVTDITRDWTNGNVLVTKALGEVRTYSADGASFDSITLDSANPLSLVSSKYQPDDILVVDNFGEVWALSHVA